MVFLKAKAMFVAGLTLVGFYLLAALIITSNVFIRIYNLSYVSPNNQDLQFLFFSIVQLFVGLIVLIIGTKGFFHNKKWGFILIAGYMVFFSYSLIGSTISATEALFDEFLPLTFLEMIIPILGTIFIFTALLKNLETFEIEKRLFIKYISLEFLFLFFITLLLSMKNLTNF